MSKSIRQRYENHYTRKVSDFIRDIGEIDTTGIPEVHLPLWGKNYETAKLRMAFVGIETQGWWDMAEFISDAKRDTRTAIFRQTEKFLQLPFVEWTNNFGTTFWDTVMQFLAAFHKVPEWQELKRRQHDEILHSFVWSETNAVERWQVTAEGNGSDFKAWEKIKAASKLHLDSYSAIIDIFRPHVAIVMHWTDDYWDRALEWESIGDHVDYAFDHAHATHVFNTAHPNWMRNERRSETFTTILKRWQTITHAQSCSAAALRCS